MGVIVKTSDLKPVHFCARGTRLFFKIHGMDWMKFVSEGLPEEEFIRTNDTMALEVVEAARKRVAENG